MKFLKRIRFLRCLQIRPEKLKYMSTQEEDIITKNDADKGIIIINRPKAVNALNLKIVKEMTNALKEWERTKNFVVIRGAGDRAFSSGCDIKAVVLATKEGKKTGYDFFKTEYRLIGYISSYKIPYIAIIDGIVMGGGFGISVYGKYRIGTEKTLFAMPESGIGLFADAGTSYFMSRMEGKLGMYLALTGDRLQGSDVFQVGIATHFCEKSKINDLETEILKCTNEDEVKVALKKYCKDKSTMPPFTLTPLMPQINHCFGAPSVEEILKRLKEDNSEWAKTSLKTLMAACPMTVKVSFRNLTQATDFNLKDVLVMDYRLAKACLDGYNFAEGVRALLIDKDRKPKWKPATYEEVTDEMISKRYSKLSDEEELVQNYFSGVFYWTI